MKKVILFAVTMVFLSTTLSAETLKRFNASIKIGLNTGDFSYITEGGLSFGLNGSYFFTKKLSGFIELETNSFGNDFEGIQATSFEVGGKYYLRKIGSLKFYGEGAVGLTNFSWLGISFSTYPIVKFGGGGEYSITKSISAYGELTLNTVLAENLMNYLPLYLGIKAEF